jgi:hypothetical protein
VAWQRGLIPLSEAAIIKAIRFNNVLVALNEAAFGWGRAYADNPNWLDVKNNDCKETETLEDIIADRAGRPRKRRFGGWIRPFLKLLAYGKHLSGIWADVFGYTLERRMEHDLITEYQDLINLIKARINKDNYNIAVDLAELPEQIRGFGSVKKDAVKSTKIKQSALIEKFNCRGAQPYGLTLKRVHNA